MKKILTLVVFSMLAFVVACSSVDADYIRVSDSRVDVVVGESKTVTAEVMPEDADQSVTWEVANSAVATVEDGVITGVKAGATTVTVRSGDAFALIDVRVTTPPADDDDDDDDDDILYEEYKGWGYGLVHGHYVGIATVTTDKDGIVTDATLDEVFLPYSWAKIAEADAKTDTVLNDDALEGVQRGNAAFWAKYLQIGDKFFTGEIVDGIPVYSATDITDLEEWVTTEENAKWYADEMIAGNYHIANSDGTKSDYVTSDASASVSVLKSIAPYWRFGANGWLGNVDATIDAVIGLDLSGDFTTSRDSETDLWSVDDTVTGATWSDFEDYFGLLQVAHANRAPYGVSYNLVHGHYVGIAEVLIDEDGLVIFATLDEVFLPYSWAKIAEEDAKTDTVLNDDALEGVQRGNATFWAKYLQIGDKFFTGEIVDGIPVYSATDITDLEEWVTTEENAKWYADEMIAGNYHIANSDGTESDYVTSDASAKVNVLKSLSPYWRFGARGWLGNVDATIDAVIGLDLSGDFTTSRDSETNFWSLDDTVTGATWSDFEDYFELLQAAYANITVAE